MEIRKTVKMKLDDDDNNNNNNNNNVTIAKSDNGSSVLILKLQDHTDKITNFINCNHFAKINAYSTNSFINTN